MSSLSSLNRNIMRISGLNSGMDTQGIISNMLKIDQQKIDRQFRAQAKMEWKVSAYQDVNLELRKLVDEFSTVRKQEQNLLSAYNYRSYKMTYNNTSDSAYVSMRAEPYAKEGSVSIQVHQLATAGTYTSEDKITGPKGEGLKLSMTMEQVSEAIGKAGGANFAIGEDGMISFTLGSQEYTFSKYATLDNVINAVNANNEKFKLGYSQLTDKFTISLKETGESKEPGIVLDSFTAAIMGMKPAVNAVYYEDSKTYTSSRALTDREVKTDSMTLQQLNDSLKAAGGKGFSINANGDVLIEMGSFSETYSSSDKLKDVFDDFNSQNPDFQVSFNSDAQRFEIKKDPGSSETLRRSSFTDAILGIKDETKVKYLDGQNAKVTINGTAVERSTNSFEIDGINYNVKQVTPEDHIVNVDIERDLDYTVDLIKKYVDSYNGLLEKLQNILGEKPDRDYYPLTEEEKSGLSEKELEKWETEAKKGILRNDSQLTNLIMQMRNSFYMKVPGSSLMLADIGIGGAASSVDSYDKARKGFIEIDETKLRSALKDNPDMVFQMFTYKDTETNNVDEMGLVSRLNALIDNYTKQNERETQYYANIDITRAKERYIDMIDAMYKKEEQLWKRFTAMETVMSNLNAQNAWLQQQLGLSSAQQS